MSRHNPQTSATIPLPLLVFAAAALSLVLAGCGSDEAGQNMGLAEALDSPERSAENRARDSYRHPAETLQFFGARPDMTVVELWPGGGWYSEILVPYLRPGKLYLAHFASDSARDYQRKAREKQAQWLRDPQRDHATLTTLGKGNYDIAPAGSADMVLTFRNLHNWLAADYMTEVFQAAWDSLKPGGVLGVVEHRAPPGSSLEWMKKSGYVTEAAAIEAAESVGFELAASSPVNNNPKDTKDHARGVWTLPPSLALGDEDSEHYKQIGESDRMTLKFVKPKG